VLNLSIVVPSFNGRETLRRALLHLRGEVPDAELIVVDGHSDDGSSRMVRREFPDARLLEFPNYGWGHATNRGLSVASGRWLLMLNSDAFLVRAAAVAMVRRLEENESVGAVGPVLIDEHGRRETVFGAINLRNYLPAMQAARVRLLSGACLMTRRDVLSHVGAIDESYHFYNDDTDWCLRVRRAGYYLERLPERVVHVGGASTPSSPLYRLEEVRGFLLMMSKHFPPEYTEFARRLAWVRGSVLKRVDPRPGHREMWARLESIAERRAYFECPFPLSGRGITHIETGVPRPLEIRGVARAGK